MNLPEIASIKIKRNKLGLKQKELANLCGVSQSLIAKLESGKIDISYRIATKIFSALENKENISLRKCQDIMTTKIISAKPQTKIAEIISLMKKHSISQIPIIERGVSVGSISERSILESLERRIDYVGEIMGPAFPTLDDGTPIQSIINLIKESDAILLTHRGKLSGIITKLDLL